MSKFAEVFELLDSNKKEIKGLEYEDLKTLTRIVEVSKDSMVLKVDDKLVPITFSEDFQLKIRFRHEDYITTLSKKDFECEEGVTIDTSYSSIVYQNYSEEDLKEIDGFVSNIHYYCVGFKEDNFYHYLYLSLVDELDSVTEMYYKAIEDSNYIKLVD